MQIKRLFCISLLTVYYRFANELHIWQEVNRKCNKISRRNLKHSRQCEIDLLDCVRNQLHQ